MNYDQHQNQLIINGQDADLAFNQFLKYLNAYQKCIYKFDNEIVLSERVIYLKASQDILNEVQEKFGIIVINVEPHQIAYFVTKDNQQVAELQVSYVIQQLHNSTKQFQEKVMIQKQQSDNSQMVQSERLCEICYMEMEQEQQLQNCGHVFCVSCLSAQLKYILKDVSQFPLTCPLCRDLISIYDIQQLITEDSNQNLIDDFKNICLNQFIKINLTKYQYCINIDCKSIMKTCNDRNGVQFYCSTCNKDYCSECKTIFHQGYTCEQKRDQGNQLHIWAKKFKLQKCPKCKAYIQKNGGCNKVLCFACKINICWKCMKTFNDPNQCYDHLNQLHGGYYDQDY